MTMKPYSLSLPRTAINTATAIGLGSATFGSWGVAGERTPRSAWTSPWPGLPTSSREIMQSIRPFSYSSLVLAMRIRTPFAGAFLLLLLVAGYVGLTPLQLGAYVNDKALHFATFFILTAVFYWIVDTNRRRTIHLTAFVCTLILGVGSEFVQGFLPNGRDFDWYDIVANVFGSLAGLGLCTWYHLRMLERKRQRRNYDAVPGEIDDDVELGEGQESGVVDGSSRPPTLEEEIDNWDENADDDWDDPSNDEGEVGTFGGKDALAANGGAKRD